MSTDADLHLSDVHLRADCSDTGCDLPCETVFPFAEAADAASSSDDAHEPTAAVDEDGDLLCARRKRRKLATPGRGRLRICHALATPLSDVGLQVWRGALLLCDHLFAREISQLLDGAVVLDLGAGCGLTSAAACLAGARAVFCTDAHTASLRNSANNADANGVGGLVRVRRLDWSAVDVWPSPSEGEFGWSSSDLQALRDATVLLAADCVYDDGMTSALVALMSRVLPALGPSAVAFVSLERRVNFCLEGMCARAPAAEHFHRELEAQRGLLVGSLVAPDGVPQRFEYERAPTLELWRVRAACASAEQGASERRVRSENSAEPVSGDILVGGASCSSLTPRS